MPEARCETAIAVEAVVAISRNDGNFYRIVTTVARGGALVLEWKAGRICACQRMTSLRHHTRDLSVFRRRISSKSVMLF
jgi:hypothetical protein